MNSSTRPPDPLSLNPKMVSSTSGPVLYCAFLVCVCIYWPVYLMVRGAFRYFYPEFYARLEREDKLKKLDPTVQIIVRIILGVFISMPTCAYAGYVTPAGPNQPLSVVGHVCIASQTTVWTTELTTMLNYNTELFIHHLTCLLVVANLVLSPSIHQIKPVYIYFAAQFADLGPAGVLIAKNTGRKPQTSSLMYYLTLASTFWLAMGKATLALHSVGMALLNPYRIGDWVWAFCLTFYALYSYGGVNSNFKWLGIIKYKEERPYATVWKDRVTIPISHTWQGLAFSFTMVSTLFVYCLFSNHPIDVEELSTISLNGLIAAAIGLTNAVVLRFAYQYMRSGSHKYGHDMYFQYGMVCAAGWICWAATHTASVDGPTALAAVGFSVPLFKATTRVARHLAVKDRETTARDTSLRLNPNTMPSAGEITPPTTPEQLSAEPKYSLETKYQRNLSIDGVLKQSAERRPSLASQSSGGSISTLEDSIILEKEKMAQRFQPGQTVVKNHLGQARLNILVYCASIGMLLYDILDLPQTAALSVVTSLTLQLPFISPGPKSAKANGKVPKVEPDKAAKACRKRSALRSVKSCIAWTVGRTMHRCILLIIILQGIMIREVLRNPDYGDVENTPLGWKNFRVALTSPVTWIGASYMLALPIAGLGISNL